MARRKTQNISLKPVEHLALLRLASEARRRPDDDLNVSGVVQDLIEERMRREYGPNWREIVGQEQTAIAS